MVNPVLPICASDTFNSNNDQAMTGTMDAPEPVYRIESNKRFRGNPLIEALPDLPDREVAYGVLAHMPLKRDADFRQAPVYRRIELLHEMQELFVPGEQHIVTLQSLMGLVRSCYSYRDPNKPEVQQALYRAGRGQPTQISRLSPSGGGSNGSVLWGVTGSGKTSFIDRFLQYLPSAPIVHRRIQGAPSQWPQIACLRIQCSRTLKGTASALLRQLDEKLGTSYWSRGNTRMSKEAYLGKVIQAMTVHLVGLLIVEDVQNLREMRAESIEVLEYFTDIMEESGIPILLVSTYAARNPILSNTKVGSKLTAKGITDFAPLNADDEDWIACIEELWKFNIFSVPTEMPANFPAMLHFYTMGVRRFAREMLFVAFEQAARQKCATLDESLLDRIAATELSKYREAVSILRRRHIKDFIAADEAKRFEDVLPPDLGSQILKGSFVQGEAQKQSSAQPILGQEAQPPGASPAARVTRASRTRSGAARGKASNTQGAPMDAEAYYEQLKVAGKIA